MTPRTKMTEVKPSQRAWYLCACGKVTFGNGGRTSHERNCEPAKRLDALRQRSLEDRLAEKKSKVDLHVEAAFFFETEPYEVAIERALAYRGEDPDLYLSKVSGWVGVIRGTGL